MFLLPNAASAQTGSITGQVRDASGGALPGVTVEVSSPALIEKVRTSTTDGNGRYQITALPVGTYEVTFTLENFGTVKRGNVIITSDFSANVTTDMKIGTRSETVNVVAEAPVVDVQNARVQTVFQGTDIADLPTTRDIPGIMLLVPSLSDGQRARCLQRRHRRLFCNPTAPTFNSHVAANDLEGGGSRGGSWWTAWSSMPVEAAPTKVAPMASPSTPRIRRRCRSPCPGASASRRPAARPSTSCRARAATGMPGTSSPAT